MQVHLRPRGARQFLAQAWCSWVTVAVRVLQMFMKPCSPASSGQKLTFGVVQSPCSQHISVSLGRVSTDSVSKRPTLQNFDGHPRQTGFLSPVANHARMELSAARTPLQRVSGLKGSQQHARIALV